MDNKKIILIILICLVLFIKIKNYLNMKINIEDEKNIINQELSEVEKELKKSGELDVLTEEDKYLGQVSQPVPEI